MSVLSYGGRLRTLLPRGWFPDDAPVLDALLAGADALWTDLWAQLAYLQAQTRVLTATGPWLDGRLADYLGFFPRRLNETDDTYSSRSRAEVLRPRATREALVQAVGDEIGLPSDTPALYVDASGAIEINPLTGAAYISTPDRRSLTVQVFEPANASDTGGYADTAGRGGLAYGDAGQSGVGGWGTLDMPFELFVQFPRPRGSGIANVAGYDTGAGGYSAPGAPSGGLAWSSPSDVRGGPTDADLYATVARVLPAGIKAWTRITGGSPPPTPAGWGQAVWGGGTWATGA